MIRVVQISDGSSRRVAVVDEPQLRCLVGVESMYELAQRCIRDSVSLTEAVEAAPRGEVLDYEAVYNGSHNWSQNGSSNGSSKWRLLTPIDVPDEPSRLLVSGTGLTHLGSATERQAMHLAQQTTQTEVVTDSMHMFRWGVEQGRPAEGEVGIAPEWFYKGDGSVVRNPFEALEIPGHAEDGGEEAEVAGVYVVGEDGTPHRIGMVAGNEFSDHKFERRNYLNLAGSKLRACSLGPELVIGGEFSDVAGEVRIERGGVTLWSRQIATGEKNMGHSLANLEHHHFKFDAHRQPGGVHVHFFGAAALSFGDGVVLQAGDWMQVQFEDFGRALRNPVREEPSMDSPIRVHSLA